MENKNPVVVFCVEGQSEIDALRDSFESLFGNTEGLEDVIVEFRQGKGDITAEWFEKEKRENANARYNKPGRDRRDNRSKHEKDKRGREKKPESSPEEEYTEFFYRRFFEPYDRPSGICWNDVTQVIQIIDIDGAYSDDIRLFTEEEMQLAARIDAENKKHSDSNYYKEEATLYYSDHIATKTVNGIDRIRDRNKRKCQRIEMIKDWDSIEYKGNCANFSVYYFSSNLDHFLYDSVNLTNSEKIRKARDFNTFNGELDAFLGFFLNSPYAAKVSGDESVDYMASWKHLWKNSLRRGTNLNLLIRKIRESAITDWM